MSMLEGRGVAWTEERGTSDEGRRRHREFMRTARASADIRGRENIVRPEFGSH
jgi:hypothetical protein